MKREPYMVRSNGPVHGFFGLTYSNYLVLPRALLQSLPVALQARLVEALEEAHELLREVPQAERYEVRVRKGKRYAEDPVPHYRRAPDLLP